MEFKINYQPNISDLNKAMCEKFWAKKVVKKMDFEYSYEELAKEYGIGVDELINVAEKESCITTPSRLCVSCGAKRVFHSRNQLDQLNESDWQCDACIEKEQLLQVHLVKKERQRVVQCVSNHRQQQLLQVPALSRIDIVDKLLLTAVVEALATECATYTIPLNKSKEIKLAPTSSLSIEVLQHLFQLNLLTLPVNGNEECIDATLNGKLEIDFYNTSFVFTYNIEELETIMVEAKEHSDITPLLVDDQFKTWCQKIQLAECLSYLEYITNQNNLRSPTGENLTNTLKKCLSKIPVKTLFYIIRKSVENAAKYSEPPSNNRVCTVNSIYRSIEAYYNKIISGESQCNVLNRPTEYPQSVISEIFFEHTIGAEDCGFKYTLEDLHITG